MKFTKTLLALAVVAALSLSLVACGAKNSTTPENSNEPSVEATTPEATSGTPEATK